MFLLKDSTKCFLRFLMAQSFASLFTFLAWISSTFPRPASKQAVVIALIATLGQPGNIYGNYIFPKAWGESYRYSFAICAATNVLAVVMILGFRAHLKALNEKAEREEQDKDLPGGYRYLL